MGRLLVLNQKPWFSHLSKKGEDTTVLQSSRSFPLPSSSCSPLLVSPAIRLGTLRVYSSGCLCSGVWELRNTWDEHHKRRESYLVSFREELGLLWRLRVPKSEAGCYYHRWNTLQRTGLQPETVIDSWQLQQRRLHAFLHQGQELSYHVLREGLKPPSRSDPFSSKQQLCPPAQLKPPERERLPVHEHIETGCHTTKCARTSIFAVVIGEVQCAKWR